MDLLICSHGN